ncbi:MAG: hypothetical protein ACOH2M_10420 [Cypionkella sp.]
MIVIAGIIIGAILGSVLARKRGGRRLDMLQYGAVYALIFAIIGMFITIVIDRMI